MLVRLTMLLIRRPMCSQTVEGVALYICLSQSGQVLGFNLSSLIVHYTLGFFWYTLLESLRRPNETLKQFGDGEGNISKEIIQTSNLP
jgi:hypothetical protein